MERFTISLNEELARQFDEHIRSKGYGNRSEAVRDLLRDLLSTQSVEREEAPFCVAASVRFTRRKVCSATAVLASAAPTSSAAEQSARIEESGDS